jgi:hypothetical protein
MALSLLLRRDEVEKPATSIECRDNDLGVSSAYHFALTVMCLGRATQVTSELHHCVRNDVRCRTEATLNILNGYCGLSVLQYQYNGKKNVKSCNNSQDSTT